MYESFYHGDAIVMCRWYVADGQADGLEEASTSGRELRGGAARIGRPEELFGSSQQSKRPARHRVIMLRGVVCTTDDCSALAWPAGHAGLTGRP